ncbi:hypothetical protein F4859DRAFT_510937 [Xylaria cf. heliscus]|nr:hypothetical protein F4859DRAFT_510937 [Xylaria cf. heliscus]
MNTITVRANRADTPASLRRMIKEGLSHEGRVKMYVPGSGVSREILDHDSLSDHFPHGLHGATINVNLESNSEDDENDTLGDEFRNDLQIGM